MIKRKNNSRTYFDLLKSNQKGVFITLTAFMLAGMLLLSASTLGKVRTMEENAITLSLAAQKNYSVKETLILEIKNAYSNAAIDWNITDNNTIIYKETFPTLVQKDKLQSNLAKLKAFFSQEFPTSGSYAPESSDLGLLMIGGKDMNIKHSATTGFGTNSELYFNYGSKKFNTITFDINTDATNLTKLTETLPLCSSCANPLNLIITVKNNTGTTIYNFNNTIDLSSTGTLDFNTSSGVHELGLSYNTTRFLLDTNTTTLTTKTTINFNDPVMDITPTKDALNITEMSSFGIKG